MNVSIDLAILELVCSRLCHDLVGPVGAATNGIELLRDISGNQNEDILDMTDESARTAWRRLEFFRVAFGHGGGRSGWSEAELAGLAAGMLRDTRVSLNWPASGSEISITGRGGKLILNMVFLIAEAMPRGGEVKVVVRADADVLNIAITGNGTGAMLNERILSTVRGRVPPDDLDSRVILAHLACLQAVATDTDIRWDFSQDQVQANMKLPQPEMADA
jgi:histidine phosphotransferase ChpT